MMPKKQVIYTVDVDGRPSVAFEGQAREAAELCKEAWFRTDLCTIASNGFPVCQPSSIIKSRIANEREVAMYRERGADVR
jgi:hypothetical protein